jgi:hypothetical protein
MTESQPCHPTATNLGTSASASSARALQSVLRVSGPGRCTRCRQHADPRVFQVGMSDTEVFLCAPSHPQVSMHATMSSSETRPEVPMTGADLLDLF